MSENTKSYPWPRIIVWFSSVVIGFLIGLRVGDRIGSGYAAGEYDIPQKGTVLEVKSVGEIPDAPGYLTTAKVVNKTDWRIYKTSSAAPTNSFVTWNGDRFLPYPYPPEIKMVTDAETNVIHTNSPPEAHLPGLVVPTIKSLPETSRPKVRESDVNG